MTNREALRILVRARTTDRTIWFMSGVEDALKDVELTRSEMLDQPTRNYRTYQAGLEWARRLLNPWPPIAAPTEGGETNES